MGLTVTEKEHWKERIERRIDKRIETVWASDPNLKERIDKEARQKALESLKLDELERESEAVEEQKKELVAREERLTRQKLAVVRGVPLDIIEPHTYYRSDQEIEQAIARRQAVFEEELLGAHEVGREIVKLREEKENLLDTIWLATSPSQLKTLWAKVSDLLHQNATSLEKEALAIPPVDVE